MIFSFDIEVMHVKHCLNSKQSPNRALPYPPQFENITSSGVVNM